MCTSPLISFNRGEQQFCTSEQRGEEEHTYSLVYPDFPEKTGNMAVLLLVYIGILTRSAS